MKKLPQLAVISPEALNHAAQRKECYENTVLIEDAFIHVSDPLPEGELQLTKMYADFVNPIERDFMFRMPGKQVRAPTSHFLKFELSTECLCTKYNYQEIRDKVLRFIDKEFDILQNNFIIKLQKSLVKELDVGLFKMDLYDQKALLELADSDIIQKVQEQANETAKEYWENVIKELFLTTHSLQEQLNQEVANFKPVAKEVSKMHQTCWYFTEDYNTIIQRLRFQLLSKQFVNNYCLILENQTDELAVVEKSLERVVLSINNKIKQITSLSAEITAYEGIVCDIL